MTKNSPEIAERDWRRHAMVRLTRDVTTGSPYVDRPTHHRAGHILTLWQTGYKDRPIDTTPWTTSLDVDLMSFIPADAVEIVEVLEEVPPRLADPVEPMHARLTRRWRRAMALVEHTADDATAPLGDRVMVHDHRQGVTRDVQNQVVQLYRRGGRPEPELLRLAADILEQVVRPGTSGYEWDVDSAQAVAADLRALADEPAQEESDLIARLWAADAALSTALQVDGAVGVDARLEPHERDQAEARFGARLAAVLSAE
ncbi:hypothetical protein [Streptosporangium sp. NPDC051022]|uniref:hypothetical protein n=1 Tax=Streptosporangium sp. NPDC051022 TaxID=3155752 RepID=UPI0034153236